MTFMNRFGILTRNISTLNTNFDSKIFRPVKKYSIRSLTEMPKGQRKLKVVTVADTHGCIDGEELRKIFPDTDVIILLGDIFTNEMDVILNVRNEINPYLPILGILGNHNPKDFFNSYPDIKDMDGKFEYITVNSEQYSVCGLSGSIKYKNSDYYCLKTHQESIDILDSLPSCDILLTHDKPMFDKPRNTDYPDAHDGLYGIGQYILNKKPKVVLHGHIHDKYIKELEETKTVIRCCYKIERFDINF